MFGKKKPQIVVEEYRDPKEMQKGMNAMLKKGYKVQGTPVERHFGRGALMGVLTRKLIVTYEKAEG